MIHFFHPSIPLVAILLSILPLVASSYVGEVARGIEGYVRTSVRWSFAGYSKLFPPSSALPHHFHLAYAYPTKDTKQQYMDYVHSIFPSGKKKEDEKAQPG